MGKNKRTERRGAGARIALDKQRQERADQPALPHWPAPKVFLLLGAMCLAYFALALPAVFGKSVTLDEGGNITVGYNILSTGNFRYCEYHPPLANLLLAAPVKMFGPEPTGTTTTLSKHDEFLFWPNSFLFDRKFRQNYQPVIELARMTTVVLMAGFGVMLFFWARTLASGRPDVAGLLAAGLVWFSPNMLAHTSLASSDAAIMIFLTIALMTFHLFLRKPDLLHAVIAGAGFGLALLTKGTSVFLVFLFPILAWVWTHYNPAASGKALIRGMIVLLVAALVVVNAGFLFQGSFHLAGSYQLESSAMKRVFSMVPKWMPVPLPESFVGAFDRQIKEAADGHSTALFGKELKQGVWYYYIFLLLIKSPLTSMALVALAAWIAVRQQLFRRFESWMLLIPAGALLFSFSVLSNKQLGLRMIMPVGALVWVWVAVTLASARLSKRLEMVALALAIGTLATTAWSCPNYIPYFNPLSGGADNAYRYTNDSNLDWGQDLIGLKKYMEQKKLSSIQLYYFGRVDPGIYGIKYEAPDVDKVKPGPLAVSATLYANNWVVSNHKKGLQMSGIDPVKQGWGKPVATIGHSIHIYNVPNR